VSALSALRQLALAGLRRLTLVIMFNRLADNGTEMVMATPELLVSSYALEVDGRLKAEFATRDGARAGGAELKKRFPTLQIKIYDAQTNAREEV
jgi:hypothetical protein